MLTQWHVPGDPTGISLDLTQKKKTPTSLFHDEFDRDIKRRHWEQAVAFYQVYFQH